MEQSPPVKITLRKYLLKVKIINVAYLSKPYSSKSSTRNIIYFQVSVYLLLFIIFIYIYLFIYVVTNPHYSTEAAKFALFPSLLEHTHV